MIHLIGAGAIGSLVATNLAYRYPISLVLRSEKQLQKYKEQSDGNISVSYRGSNYQREIPAVIPDQLDHIQNLVVTTKAHQTLGALESLQRSLTAESVVLLLQNGVGVKESLIQRLWPDPASRPMILEAITATGVKRTSKPWHFVQQGDGFIFISQPPVLGDTARALIKTFTNSRKLVISETTPHREFLVRQYEKLVVNASINPLTAVVGCQNGRLLKMPGDNIMAKIVSESCRILRQHTNIYENDVLPAMEIALQEPRMLKLVRGVCQSTAGNVSSMLADVEHGRPTEIEYINGTLVKMASISGLSSKFNQSMVSLVNMRQEQMSWELKNRFAPLEME